MFRGIIDGDGGDVAGFRGNPYGPEKITFEDQCRIVACVNALAGIPTSLLTTGTRCQIASALADLDLGSLPDKVKAALQTDTEVPRAQH